MSYVKQKRREALRDQIAFFSQPLALRPAVYGLTDAIQQHQPAVQLLSLGVGLHLLCAATGVDIRQVLQTAENAISDVDGPFSDTMNALKAYADGELLGMAADGF